MQERPYLHGLEIGYAYPKQDYDAPVCSDCLDKTDCFKLGLVTSETYEYIMCSMKDCNNFAATNNVVVYRTLLPAMTISEYLIRMEQ